VKLVKRVIMEVSCGFKMIDNIVYSLKGDNLIGVI
jgi:hypothetical protein